MLFSIYNLYTIFYGSNIEKIHSLLLHVNNYDLFIYFYIYLCEWHFDQMCVCIYLVVKYW